MQRFEFDTSDFEPISKKETKFTAHDFEPISKKSSNPVLDFAGKQWDIEKNIGKDIYNTAKKIPGAAIEAIGNIPKDIEYLKKNIPAAGSLIINDPKSAAKEALAGAGDLAGQVSRMPPALINYLAKIGMINPETAKNFPKPFSEEQVTNAMNNFAGEEQPGGGFIRGAVRDSPSLYGAGKLIKTFNPATLSTKNIINDVLTKERLQKGLHTKAYDKIWDEAEKTGFNKVPFNSKDIDINAIKKHSIEKFYSSTEDFLKEPTLKNAQKAQSDLGKLINSKELNKPVLTSKELATRDAAIKAKEHIKNSMFKNEKGILNKSLKKQYDTLTKSYEKNVIPYSTNKAIQEFKRGDLDAKETLQKISKGKFRAKKGSAHPQIGNREFAGNALKIGGISSGIGGSVVGVNWLLNKLLGNHSGEV